MVNPAVYLYMLLQEMHGALSSPHQNPGNPSFLVLSFLLLLRTHSPSPSALWAESQSFPLISTMLVVGRCWRPPPRHLDHSLGGRRCPVAPNARREMSPEGGPPTETTELGKLGSPHGRGKG